MTDKNCVNCFWNADEKCENRPWKTGETVDLTKLPACGYLCPTSKIPIGWKHKTYLQFLNDEYGEWQKLVSADRPKWVFLSEYVFDFITYDDDTAELFVRKALEVCKAVTEGAVTRYAGPDENYQWLMILRNMPWFMQRLSGTGSVREVIWVKDRVLLIDGLNLSVEVNQYEDWILFITGLLEFAGMAPAPRSTDWREDDE